MGNVKGALSSLTEKTFPYSWNMPMQSRAGWEDYRRRDERFQSDMQQKTIESLKNQDGKQTWGVKKQMSEAIYQVIYQTIP